MSTRLRKRSVAESGSHSPLVRRGELRSPAGVQRTPLRSKKRFYKNFFNILQSVPKCATINPERRWIYEGTQDNQSHTVRLDIQHESFSCGLPLAVRTERKYYARYLTYRTLPSESVVLAIMADYPLLAAHATEATDLPKDHFQPRAPRDLRTSVRYLLYAFWKLVLMLNIKTPQA